MNRGVLDDREPGRARSLHTTLRWVLLAVALLTPLNVPSSLPEVEADRRFGWSFRAPRDGPETVQLATRTMRHAHQHGLLPGDRIVGIGGLPADSATMASVLEGARAGDTLRLAVERGAEAKEVLVPVAANTLSYSSYLWYRIVLSLLAWAVAVGILFWRGASTAGLLLAAALLLYAPITLPPGNSGEGFFAELARQGWQLLAGAQRFVFPALLLHFVALHSLRPRFLRSRYFSVLLYGTLAVLLLLITDGLRSPILWAEPGPQREIRALSALAFQGLALSATLSFYGYQRRVAPAVRWVLFSILLMVATDFFLNAAVLVLGELSPLEALWRVNGITLLLLPVCAAYFLVATPERIGSWERRRLVASAVSIGITIVYGIALAVVAAVVLSSMGHSLHGAEWLLFLSLILGAAIFSPLVRWAQETADRRMFARWIELELRASDFANRLGSELEPVRIRERIQTELPPLLDVEGADLVLAEEVVEAWGVERRKDLAVRPEKELLAVGPDVGPDINGAGPVTFPVRGPEGRLWGALVVRIPRGHLGVEPPDRAVYQTLVHGVSNALRSAEQYHRLRKIQAELAEANRMNALGMMAAGLAHSIKNPLASLKMGVYLLEKDGKVEDRAVRIRRDLQRIDDLVSSLLRLTQDGAPAPGEAVDVNDVVRRCVEDVRPMAEDRDIRLIESLTEEPLIIRADAQQLRLIVSNLLDNALTAAGPGGRVAVALSGDPQEVVLEVRDNGGGIPPEIRDRIFELSFTTRQNGTGLGLAVVRRETERIGGSITVESEPGRGTCLRFRAPRLIYQAQVS